MKFKYVVHAHGRVGYIGPPHYFRTKFFAGSKVRTMNQYFAVHGGEFIYKMTELENPLTEEELLQQHLASNKS